MQGYCSRCGRLIASCIRGNTEKKRKKFILLLGIKHINKFQCVCCVVLCYVVLCCVVLCCVVLLVCIKKYFIP